MPIQQELIEKAAEAASRIDTLEMSQEESQEILGETRREAEEHAWWRWVLAVQLGEARAALAACEAEHGDDDYGQGTYGEGTYGSG